MLIYIYEKFFQKFVIEDIAECFDSFEKQHKDILTNHCRCTKREYPYYPGGVGSYIPDGFIDNATACFGSFGHIPEHHRCGTCGKPITEQSNLDVYHNVNGNGEL